MGFLDTIFGGAINLGIGAFNNTWAQDLQHTARIENYELGEKAAENADKRTRALYKDLYSPQALLQQYQAAGLSPSMMFGGTPGQGGTSGAQGTGAAGPGAVFSPLSMLEGAQVANLVAQTKKTEAETRNIDKDTDLKKLQEEWQEMANSQYKTEFTLLNAGYQMPDGSVKSYYDIAGDYDNFDKYIAACREAAIQAGDQGIVQTLASEQGLKTMRAIYMARKEMAHDISVLSSEKVSADFQKAITNELKKAGFEKLNAEAAVAQLRSLSAASELTETQKTAWNNLINKLGEKNSTMRDIVVVLGMLLGNFANGVGVKINVGSR